MSTQLSVGLPPLSPVHTHTCRSVTAILLPPELHNCVIPNLSAIAPVRRDSRVHFLAATPPLTAEVRCGLPLVAVVGSPSADVGIPVD